MREREGRERRKYDEDKGEEKRWKREGRKGEEKEDRRKRRGGRERERGKGRKRGGKKKRGNEREEEEHDDSLPWHPTSTIVGCILSSSEQLVQEAAY